jgi:2-polyprenyl-3-methyl-5-hydroxy-6-metoxy-1,4-benzoquinol methylase
MKTSNLDDKTATIERACPVCGGTAAEPFLTKLELRLVRCQQCSMVYANPVPAEMATGEFYDRAGSEYLSPEKLQSDYADVRFERELRLFREHCRGGSVLDVGCSSGGFLYQLQKRFPGKYKVLGTDVSQAPLDHAVKMGVPVVRGEFLKQSLGEKFDAVTFWAVMEHLAAPELFLKKAAEVLKPGGYCFILTPNLKSLAVRLIGAKYRYIFPEHLNYFTAETMRRFVEREFTVTGMKSTHFNPLVIWQDFRGGERDIPRAERIKLLKRTTGYKQSRWMWPVKTGYRATEALLSHLMMADNVAAVGRKK